VTRRILNGQLLLLGNIRHSSYTEW